ncbi:MAG: exodeoxyribonuclease III [Pseudomonadota bacterium]
MRIVSFNVNSIRARAHQLAALCTHYSPDIIGLQETKVQDSEFPQDMVAELGYQAVFHGQKGHYGVAILSKQAACSVSTGFPGESADAQRRLIRAEYPGPQGRNITVINGYFPQGEQRGHATKFPHKRSFYADLHQLLSDQYRPDDLLLVLGDMNVAPADQDIGIGPANAKRWLRDGKCSFLPEEREWLQRLCDWGLHDTFRSICPQVDDQFSWFDYRSKGFAREPKRGLRIDLVLATAMLNQCVTGAGIAYDIRAMDKPSDHAPVWTDIEIS